MPSISRTLGLRLSVWYGAVFVISTVALVVLTYGLMASSLAQRDHDIIRATLREYASRMGLRTLALPEEAGGAGSLRGGRSTIAEYSMRSDGFMYFW